VKKVMVVLIPVVVIAVAGSAVFIAVGMKGKGGDGPQGDVVRVENPERGELVEFINAPGEVEPRSKVNISAKVSARIIELPFEEGDRVTAGGPDANPPVAPSVLVRLDATEFEAALRSTEARRAAQAAQIEVEKARIAAQEAQLKGCTAVLTKAQLDLARYRQLVESGDITQSDLDNVQSLFDERQAAQESAQHTLAAARANIDVLKHNLDAADAEITRARDALSYTTITSPIDGVLTRVNAKEGELVVTGTMNNPGTVIMQVADLSEMLIVLQVDEADIGKVAVDQTAQVRIHAYPGEKFEGTVESIALTHNFTSGGAKYFRTKIVLDTAGKTVYSGLTADVDIRTERHKGVIKVPSQAILGRPIDDLPLSIRENNPNVDLKKTYATVVYRFVDGKALVTPVTIGASDATHTVVLTGLTETDRIVTGPYKILEGIEHDQNIQDEREVEKSKKAESDKPAPEDAQARVEGEADKDSDENSTGQAPSDAGATQTSQDQ
jgi:HlyD family secretion protein